MKEVPRLTEIAEACSYISEECEDVAVWDIYYGSPFSSPDLCSCDAHLSKLLSSDEQNIVVSRPYAELLREGP